MNEASKDKLNCKICQSSFFTLKSYIIHLQLHHRNKNRFNYPCGFFNCSRTFIKVTSLKAHISRDHNKFQSYGFQSLSYQCSLDACKRHCASKNELIKHLQDHIRKNEVITCPFEKCNLKFRNRSTFSSHLTRKHTPQHATIYTSSTQFEESTDNIGLFEKSVACSNQAENIEISSSAVENRLGLLCLKLMSKHHLPAFVIDIILNEIKDIHELCNESLLQKLRTQLKKVKEIEEAHINEIENLVTNNLLSDVLSGNGVLRSDNQRRLYFKQNFYYVEPVEYMLGKNKYNRVCTFHYVPIIKSILTLISNKSVVKQLENPLATNNKTLSDFQDGTIYATNKFFQSSTLKILLFQDSFESVNPLGSGKTKHKILAIYYTLGNIYPWFRSKVEPLQLILLCRQKDFEYFGHEAVFRPLIEDLKLLEDGINDKGKLIQGSLFAIMGDNLGSHCIGGFTENFSSALHSCRYCLVHKRDMFSENFHLKHFEPRNKENYNNTLQVISDSNIHNLNGIKFNSIFNELKHFHVCQPGLPPCLGHDLFEGVIAFDLFLFVKRLVEEKHISSIDVVNRRIINFKLGSSDCSDKPCEINAKGSRLSGHAVQNWTFLRLFPIIFWDVFKTQESKILDLVTLLHRITEFVCAPTLTIQQICFLQDLIEDYLEARVQAFPDKSLRPKHHYLTHYPMLIKQFGPLIRLWTMRFEAKHSYFKKCVKHTQNFKNLTKTMSERHQFLQSFIATGEIFNDQPILPDSASKFHIHLYDKNVQKIVTDKIGACGDAVISQNICFRGINYKTNMFLPILRNESNIIFGKIIFILKNPDKICFLVNMHNSSYSPNSNLYILESSEHLSLKAVFFDELLDYYPLNSYLVFSDNLISLKHSIVDDYN